MYALEKLGLTLEILDSLSYKSELGINLKRSLARFDKDKVIDEIKKMRIWYNQDGRLDGLAIDSRLKSVGSAIIKYEKYYPNTNFSTVFNDILGFRAICSSYDEIIALEKEEKIRVVNMTQGKAHNDGYRGVHIYYQKDNYHYPIEIQFNSYYDRQFNNWLHDKFYKRGYDDKIGQILREQYENGKIKSINDFEGVLKDVLSSS